MCPLKDIKATLDQLMGRSLNPSSSEQPSYQEDHDSSHYQGPHSTHLPRDLCLPRIEVNKFDGSDPTGWVTQMEHYFSLHGITDDLAKLRYGILHLDLERWKWWQWCKKARQGYVAWTQFVAELYDRFDSDTHHLGRLTKLKQSGTVEDFIATFEHLDFRTEGMSDAFFRECFISGLKDEIVPMFSWHTPRLGWKLLNEPRKHNRLSPPRSTNHPFLLTLNPPIPPLLQLPSRSRN
jgi:hypothetical protein